jgi:hypothetical protein
MEPMGGLSFSASTEQELGGSNRGQPISQIGTCLLPASFQFPAGKLRATAARAVNTAELSDGGE